MNRSGVIPHSGSLRKTDDMGLALWETFFRSFFVQTLWNYERMQNVGFAYAIEPLLRRLAHSKSAYRRMLRRQLIYFNTHPYFTPIVIGVVYAKEKSRTNRDEEDPTLTVLKDSMGGAFGAIGDHVIWGTWRPFAALLALSVGLLVASPNRAWPVCAQWWVIGFLCLFNTVHFWLRGRGLQKAVQDGPGVVRWVESLHMQAWAAQVRRMGLILLVVLILVYLGRWSTSNLQLWMFGVLLGTVVFKRWAVSGFWIFYLVCVAAMALGYLGIH
jgi:mannose/fructose/N-acetylgalactosamine-specific phosphotransferase system component IID